MVMGTNKYAELINKRLCNEFGVDKFNAEQILERGPSITRTEIIYYKILFWWFCSEHRKSFYPWHFSWTVEGESWQVILEPVVKKTKEGKSVYFDLDEQEMRRRVRNLILKKRGNNANT